MFFYELPSPHQTPRSGLKKGIKMLSNAYIKSSRHHAFFQTTENLAFCLTVLSISLKSEYTL